jgi:glycosyltransferase involved in cell wall biosynthesis
MKFAFICGSLEPARDGVGDYLRRLGLELLQQGHQVSLIAIHDPHVAGECLEPQETFDTTFSIIRFPELRAHSLQLFLLRTWLAKFDPDLISLHYVPFAFHRKGLSFDLCKKLQYIGEGRNWHVMFHELWLGMEEQCPLKYKLWGFPQKWLIMQLLTTLKPLLISTHTPLYQAQLKRLGFEASIFPLFSNIPVTQLEQDKERQAKEISFVVFGNISDGAPFKEFTQEAMAYAKEQQKLLSLVFIGRCGKEMGNWVSRWSETGLKFKVLGEQPEKIVSETLSKADFGLCSTPFVLIEKSGAVAAMRAHGLPVICISKPWIPKGITGLSLPADVIVYQPGRFSDCVRQQVVAAPVFQVAEAANQLLKYNPHESHADASHRE